MQGRERARIPTRGKLGGGLLDRAVQEGGPGATAEFPGNRIRQWVGQRVARVQPLHSVALQVERAEGGADHAEGVGGRAVVDDGPGAERVARGSGRSPGRGRCLEDLNLPAGAGQPRRRGQAVRPGADNRRFHHTTYLP